MEEPSGHGDRPEPSGQTEAPKADYQGSEHEGEAKEVAVLVEIDDTWGRKVVEAISLYSQEHNWNLLIAPKDPQRRLRVPSNWTGDGVITMLLDPSLTQHVKSLGLPSVDVCNMYSEEKWLGRVCTDDTARARMAFDHLHDRMYSHFACYSPRIGRYPGSRTEEFVSVVASEGYQCEVFPPEREDASAAIVDHQMLRDWVAGLPKPVCIFTPDAYPARQLVETVHSMDVAIPDDIAVLAGDEDELLCDILSPGISSIELACHQIGIKACECLKEVMQTNKTPEETVLIQPLGVCTRRSTEHLAIKDRHLASVVKMIWEQACDGIQVKDLVKESAMSRRTLEQRFREILGRTPAEEIRRARLEKARHLILTTTQTVSCIAVACGFSSGPYLTQAFKKQYGRTPSSLRIGREGTVVK